MGAALYKQTPSVGKTECPVRDVPGIQWWRDLPSPIQGLVIAPIRFDVLQDYEIRADRTKGYDDHNDPCYCAFRYVLTQLRSDDDEVFYEAPVYAETLISWRLLDERWLTCRTTIGNFDLGESDIEFSVSDAMPR